MKIFNQTKHFFETEKEWNIPRFTLMTYSDKGIYWINITDVKHIKQSCPDRIPFEHITNQSQTWSQSQSKSIRITVMLVSLFHDCNVLDETMTIFFTSRKHNFFVVLKSPADCSQNRFFETNHILPLKSFEEFNSEEFYSKVCYIKCQKQNHSLMIGKFLKSYYHLAENLTMSSNEARQYCAQKQSSYLLSLESYDEMEFIFRTFGKQGVVVHVGINIVRKGRTRLTWASSNPFILKYHFNFQVFKNYYGSKYPEKCFIISSEKYDNESILHVDSKTNQQYNIMDVDCDKPIEYALVICECHLPISNNQITLETQEMEDMFLIDHFYISNFFRMINSEKKYIQLINCFLHLNYSNQSLIENMCRKYIGPIIKSHRKVAGDFPIIRGIKGLRLADDLNILKIVNISSCQFNDYCKKSETWLNCVKNINSCKDCLEDRDICLQRHSLIEINLEKFTCESDMAEFAFRCIKTLYRNCIDNYHLQHCENFTCPHNSVKCYRSYCIPLEMSNNGEPDCPHGEDEFVKSKDDTHSEQCFGNILAYLKDVCLTRTPFYKDKEFLCSPACPDEYTCISHRRLKDDNTQSIEMYKFHVPLYNISNSYYPEIISTYFPILNIVELSLRKCKVENFDLAFKNWRLSHLLELDLSYNILKSSDEMNLFHDMIKLTFLNLSNNPSLRIGDKFTFPKKLKTIDLSYTSFKSIQGKTFVNLKRLKNLDLRGTKVLGFKDMGIPKFFILDTLYIQSVQIFQIQQDFFAGLTIQTGLWTSDFRLCCPQILNANISVDKCHGPTDAISSCKHLIGDVFKRLVIWIVGLITIVGNGIVLIYRLVCNRELFKKAYGLFVTGLALSDFIMGIYLMIIASVDIDYKDMYVLEETNWRNGMLCQISGFLSTLSSETSTFFICLITLDRYLKITYPFGEYKLSQTWTRVLFTLAWLVGIVLAAIPIVISSWEIYSTNGLCLALPFSSIRFSGWEFTFVVYVGVNFVLFLLIALGQVAIFVHIKRRKQFTSCLKNSRNRRLEDLAVARKLAFVAMSDFLCWFPIGIIGIYSMNGHTFNSDVYAWFAVFVLPINSALNPIIYTIPTLYAKCKQNT
ncbi:G-protein coupled receptor GRL101-like isoform X2 [Biomphalaria glabrata]|nr:G-protein coupled receptor GRL101-like isoform X2 [Biomphalaria glabrata]